MGVIFDELKKGFRTAPGVADAYKQGAAQGVEATKKATLKAGELGGKTLATGARVAGKYLPGAMRVGGAVDVVDGALRGGRDGWADAAAGALTIANPLAGGFTTFGKWGIRKLADSANKVLDQQSADILGKDVIGGTGFRAPQPTVAPAPTTAPTTQPPTAEQQLQDQTKAIQTPGATPAGTTGPTILGGAPGHGPDLLADGRQKIIQASNGLRKSLSPDLITKVMNGEGDITGLRGFGQLLSATMPARMELAQAKSDYNRTLGEAKHYDPLAIKMAEINAGANKAGTANTLAAAKLEDDRMGEFMKGFKGRMIENKSKDGKVSYVEDAVDAEEKRQAVQNVIGEKGLRGLMAVDPATRESIQGELNTVIDMTRPFNAKAQDSGGTVIPGVARGFKETGPAELSTDFLQTNGVGLWDVLRGNMGGADSDMTVSPLYEEVDPKTGKSITKEGQRMLKSEWLKQNGGIDIQKANALAQQRWLERIAQRKQNGG